MLKDVEFGVSVYKEVLLLPKIKHIPYYLQFVFSEEFDNPVPDFGEKLLSLSASNPSTLPLLSLA